MVTKKARKKPGPKKPVPGTLDTAAIGEAMMAGSSPIAPQPDSWYPGMGADHMEPVPPKKRVAPKKKAPAKKAARKK
jgi:hypothetical protein